MEQVPTMISTKDLDYLSDIFNWNFNACKLISHMKKEVTCEEINNLFDTLLKMHNNICSNIVDIMS